MHSNNVDGRHQNFGSFFNNEKYSDVTIVVVGPQDDYNILESRQGCSENSSSSSSKSRHGDRNLDSTAISCGPDLVHNSTVKAIESKGEEELCLKWKSKEPVAFAASKVILAAW